MNSGKPVVTINLVDAILGLEGGQTIEEFKDQVRLVVRKVLETRKPGSVSLTLKIELANPANPSSSQLKIGDDVKASVPRIAGSTPFYGTEDGNLSHYDPLQPSFEELREQNRRGNQ